MPPLQLLIQIVLQLLVLLHQLVIVAGLHIVLHKGEGGLVELLVAVLRQKGAALAPQTLHVDDHQPPVLLRQLEQLQLLRHLQPQIEALIHDLQQAVLLGLG